MSVNPLNSTTYQSTAPRAGRNLIYVVAALLVFAVLWWLTTPGAPTAKIEQAKPVANVAIAAQMPVAAQTARSGVAGLTELPNP